MVEYETKKRKRPGSSQYENGSVSQVDTSKPTAIFKSLGKGRQSTLSIAVPGSIIANAQTHDLKTALAGRIARAAAVFCVDEIIIFNDRNNAQSLKPPEDGYTGDSDPEHFLFHVLSYLECPPYIRKRLYPLHPNMRTAGSLPSLDMPHHLKADEWCQYREGVTIASDDPKAKVELKAKGDVNQKSTTQNIDNGVQKKRKKKKQRVSAHYAPDEDSTATLSPSTTCTAAATAQSTFVDVGFSSLITVAASIPPNTRVTLKFPSAHRPPNGALTAEAVHPSTPREEAGYYWGYELRTTPSLRALLKERSKYDLTIGTSERGVPLASIIPSALEPAAVVPPQGSHLPLPRSYNHALIVFGGPAGLESAAAIDDGDEARSPADVADLFDYWVNAVPGQGSRTIRTEEALWIVLGRLWDWIREAGGH